jgi:hypothetical protein
MEMAMTRAEQILVRLEEIDRELDKLRPDPKRSDMDRWLDGLVNEDRWIARPNS